MSAEQTDAFIAALPEWQRTNLTRFREAVHRVAPAAEEGWKWDVPVFLANGRLICAMSNFAKHTKYNLFDGAALADPDHLFNSGLDSKKSRSINLAQGETVDGGQLDRLLRDAFSVAGATSTKPR
ncbi:MAG TPA: DUF1801 domain-containing protein [Candidatus Dormibacteraeota bacterium]|nr:DUF1801 domain-containing protein [Candidatus Dormibacteraeota bacterium]